MDDRKPYGNDCRLAEEKTILITSHNLDMVADLCNRFLIMDKGKVLMEILKTHIKKLLINKDRITDISW